MTDESRNNHQCRPGGIRGHVPAEQPVTFSGMRSYGGIPGRRKSLDVLQRAYADSDVVGERARLRLAFAIAVTYRGLAQLLASSEPSEVAVAEASLAAFIAQAREDLRWDAMLTDISDAPAGDPERTGAGLSTVCNPDALSTFGPRDCVELLAAVVEAGVTSGGSAAGLQLADAVAVTMASLAVDGWRLESDYPDWRGQFAGSLRRLMSGGVETAITYSAYARFEADAEARLIALQRGSALFPADGELALALGVEYLRREMREDAIAQLLIARGSLPDYFQGRVDGLMSIARGEAEMPAEWRTPESGEPLQ